MRGLSPDTLRRRAASARGPFLCSFGTVASGANILSLLLPPALVTRTMSLGSTAITTGGSFTVEVVGSLMLASLALTVLGWAVAVLHLRRADVKA